MASIFLADLDNNIVDAIAERELVGFDRAICAYDLIIKAFHTIADEERDIKKSRYVEQLSTMAGKAAEDWYVCFASRPDRRVVLIKMFPLAVEIIDKIRPAKKDQSDEDWASEFRGHIDGDGYPDYWSHSMREVALTRGYNATAFMANPDIYLGSGDIQFIKDLERDYM